MNRISRLDVALWNLSVAAAAACGQTSPADGDTEGTPMEMGTQDTEDPPSPTDPEPTTSGPDPQVCEPACEPGYVCKNGLCELECYADLECEPDDDECYYAEDCFDGVCIADDFGDYCTYENDLPQCEGEVALTRVIPIPADVGGALALAFGDAQAEGGDELLVVAATGARLVTASGASVTPAATLPASTEMWATAAATASGVGFAISGTETGGTILVTLDADALVVGAVEGEALTHIDGGDFDGDGIGDIVGLLGASVRWSRGTSSGFVPQAELGESSGPPTAGHLEDGTIDQIAFHIDDTFTEYIPDVGTPRVRARPDPYRARQRTLTSGDLDGDGDEDIVGITTVGDGMIVFASGWVGVGRESLRISPVGLAPALETNAGGFYRVATGDLDGVGADDLMVGGEEVIRVFFGDREESTDERIRCWLDVPVPHPARVIATGDLDGDGRSDVAFSDGTTTTVLAND